MSREPGIKKTTVLSIDYDGCTAVLYGDYGSDSRYSKYISYVEYNTALFNHIVKLAEHYNEIIVMVGSARQSVALDKQSAIKCINHESPSVTSSVFSDLPEFTQQLQTILREQGFKTTVIMNGFLLEDLFYNKGHGSTFLEIIEMNYIKKINPLIREYNPDNQKTTMAALENLYNPFQSTEETSYDGPSMNTNLVLEFEKDTFKIKLITEQLKHIAAQYSAEGETFAEIHFDFFDDRVDILNALANYFTENSGQIQSGIKLSANITLRLFCYQKGKFYHTPQTKNLATPVSDKLIEQLVPTPFFETKISFTALSANTINLPEKGQISLRENPRGFFSFISQSRTLRSSGIQPNNSNSPSSCT